VSCRFFADLRPEKWPTLSRGIMAIGVLSLTAVVFAWLWSFNVLALKAELEMKAANKERAEQYVPPPKWLAFRPENQ
jgi:hypothetical protein